MYMYNFLVLLLYNRVASYYQHVVASEMCLQLGVAGLWLGVVELLTGPWKMGVTCRWQVSGPKWPMPFCLQNRENQSFE